MSDNSQSGSSVIAKRINDWQRKLLDLTRKNPLVYYRQTKSHIRISHPDIQSIYYTLVVERKPLKFPTALLNGSEETFSPKPNELICQNLSRTDLRKALKSLTDKPALFYKEYGIRTLYIALNSLHWKESEHSNECSPLILCPVDLKYERFSESFVLSLVEEDDISINPAFQVKLKRDFKLDLPSAPEEWEVNSLQDYIDQVNQLIKPNESQWSIEPDVILGVFKFNNIGIYRDLVENFSLIEANPLIRILSGEQQESHLVDDIPSAKELDKTQKPQSTFQFLEADSSQQRCIQAALSGKNLVIDGPPGTGKSQTISNIIAEFIARGKTVLFVSAKIAALEVVYKKLKDSKLDDFCLELHSEKVKKTYVQGELKRCVEASNEEERLPNIDVEFKKLEQTRKQINDYVLALHMPRGNLNESVSSILGKLAQLHQFPLIEIHITNPNNISPEWIQQRRELVVRLETVWQVVEQGEAFPWFNCTETQFNSETKTWWRSHLERLISEVNTLYLTSGELSTFLGVNTTSTLNDIDWLISLSNHLIA